MTANLSCEALRDDIIALLYDDGEAAERSRARDHLALCVPCRADYTELKGVRTALGGWTLPTPVAVPRPKTTFRWFPTALAAAAGLVLGIGVAVAGRSTFFPASPAESASAVPSTSSGTDRGRPVAERVEATAPSGGGENARFVSYDELQEILRTQEGRHLSEIAQLRQTLIQMAESAPASTALKSVSNPSSANLEKLLRASEERQARMFEARLAGLRTENDLQRQYDMAQIAAGLAYIDSRTGADAARTSELMKNLVRVTAKPQDR